MRRRLGLAMFLGATAVALTVTPVFATIHPLVESFDCANEQAFEHHPLEDPADPPGATPGATPGDGVNALRALFVISDGFTDPTSPALFGHKLDGECGSSGP